MKGKKQQNGKAKVDAPKAAVNEETEAVTTKTNTRKRQSTEALQAVPAKILKKQQEPVLSATAKSKKRKDRKKKTAAAAAAATAAAATTSDAKPINPGRVKPPKDEEKEKIKKELAIAYLKLWKEDRKNWKFKKNHQIWLNDNVFSSVMLPDNLFSTWLEYMAGSSDAQKKLLVRRSTEALKELEVPKSTVKASDVKYQRAKKVIQSMDVKVEEKEESEGDEEEDDESSE